MNLKNTRIYDSVRSVYHALMDWEKTVQEIKCYCSIRPFKNQHIGNACVVIGNGPSLRVEDLTKLHELGIPTFACNRIHLIFPQTPWRPTYYFMSYAKLVKQYTDNVPDVPADHRFFPANYRKTIRNGRFYNVIQFDYEHEGRFSLDVAKGVYPAASVTTEMIQFAYYMGFSEIYLIGVDFSYAVTQKLDSKTYSYQGENNYFIPGYLKPGEVADMPNVNANLLGFHAARQAIEGHGRTIRNATRGGKLEVFERIDLDQLFAKWEEHKA
jgi:hypothetical protein